MKRRACTQSLKSETMRSARTAERASTTNHEEQQPPHSSKHCGGSSALVPIIKGGRPWPPTARACPRNNYIRSFVISNGTCPALVPGSFPTASCWNGLLTIRTRARVRAGTQSRRLVAWFGAQRCKLSTPWCPLGRSSLSGRIGRATADFLSKKTAKPGSLLVGLFRMAVP